ncbi:MAG: hypothetical protein IPN09_05900 [Bacteroidetes bacterium]|nr:hypothetical protein [Bacteroidota bacterium]
MIFFILVFCNLSSCKQNCNIKDISYSIQNDTLVSKDTILYSFGEKYNIYTSTLVLKNKNWERIIVDTSDHFNFKSSEAFYNDKQNNNLYYFSKYKKLYKINLKNGNIVSNTKDDCFFWGKSNLKTVKTNLTMLGDKYLIVNTTFDVLFFDKDLNYLYSIFEMINSKKNIKGMIIPEIYIFNIETKVKNNDLFLNIKYTKNMVKDEKDFIISFPEKRDLDNKSFDSIRHFFNHSK